MIITEKLSKRMYAIRDTKGNYCHFYESIDVLGSIIGNSNCTIADVRVSAVETPNKNTYWALYNAGSGKFKQVWKNRAVIYNDLVKGSLEKDEIIIPVSVEKVETKSKNL